MNGPQRFIWYQRKMATGPLRPYPTVNQSHIFKISRSDYLAQFFFQKLIWLEHYYQIPVEPSDIHKTAVTTLFGLFNFTRTPFGLRNSGQTFQRFIDHVTRGLDIVFVYLDDLLVTSPDHKTHKNHFKILFARLAEYGIIIGPEKCQFGATEFLRPPRLCWRNFAVTQRRRRHSQFRKARKATSVAKIFRNGKLLSPFHTAMRSEVDAIKLFIDSSQWRSYKTVTEVEFWIEVGRECRVSIFRVQTNIGKRYPSGTPRSYGSIKHRVWR